MYYNRGEMTVLHVPMESPLTEEQKEQVNVVLAEWGIAHYDDAYLEVVQGHVLERCVTKQLLKDVFGHEEPVEQYVKLLEMYDAISQELKNKCQRTDIEVGRCSVGYVSMELE